jgi:hypothetical protein
MNFHFINKKSPFISCMICCILLHFVNVPAKWRPVNTGLEEDALCVNTLMVIDDNLFIGTNNGVFKSFLQDISWKQINSGLTSLEVLASVTNGITMWIGTGTYSGGVFRLDSVNESWKLGLGEMSNMAQYVNALAICGDNLFAATEDGLWRQPINDIHWKSTNSGIPRGMGGSVGISAISLSCHNSEIYAGVLGAGIFISTNNGADWIGLNTGLSGHALYVWAIAFIDNDIYIGTDGAGVLKSMDGGNSWIECNSGLKNLFIRAFAVNGTTVYAGTDGNGVFESSDQGGIWTEINAGLTLPINVRSLIISGENIFTGTFCKGVFVNSLTSLGIAPEEPEMTRRFDMKQNYPNPFNNSTKIELDLKSNSSIKAKIFSLLGKDVKTLLDDYYEPGVHYLLWDGTNDDFIPVPSGIYYVRIEAFEGSNLILSKSQKVIYLK